MESTNGSCTTSCLLYFAYPLQQQNRIKRRGSARQQATLLTYRLVHLSAHEKTKEQWYAYRASHVTLPRSSILSVHAHSSCLHIHTRTHNYQSECALTPRARAVFFFHTHTRAHTYKLYQYECALALRAHPSFLFPHICKHTNAKSKLKLHVVKNCAANTYLHNARPRHNPNTQFTNSASITTYSHVCSASWK